jgi:hypothetical protein
MNKSETVFCKDCFWGLPEDIEKIIRAKYDQESSGQNIFTQSQLLRACPDLRSWHRINVKIDARCVNRNSFKKTG